MKVALVHDWLNTKFGGAENVLVELADLFPEAPIYTLLYNREVCGSAINPERVRTSRLQRLPAWLQRRPRYLLPLIPMAVEQFDFAGFDVVISSSSAWSKGIITRPETLHICYCHTPMRFVWDYWPAYIGDQHVGKLRRAGIHLMTSRLRLWDYYSAARVDRWIANSQTVAARIQKYYRQPTPAVIYPGVEIDQFKPATPDRESGDPYFVTLSSLTPYKRIDLAIAACNQLSKRLVVIGEGSDSDRLQKLAGPTIEFAGRVSDERKAKLLAGAEALIFPNQEDFGIAPVEAMACGTPVIALGRGGATETTVNGSTGLWFDHPTTDSLCQALRQFNRSDYSASRIRERASKFTTDKFRRQIKDFVEKAHNDHQR